LIELSDNRKTMNKILEIVGLILIGIMVLSFVGFLGISNAGVSPLFWVCAIGTLLIIIYKKKKTVKK
jgi:FtsH-binding integral membrane protein